MNVRIVLMLLMLLLTAESQAQFWKSKKSKNKNEPTSQYPNSLDPTTSTRKEYAPKESSKSPRRSSQHSPEHQFFERMEELEKVRRKNERMMEKPQYSDPMYFGHKRPPKKRKASRMKFCKECGIRH